MIYLGDDKIGRLYLGNTEIGKAYLGNNLVFQKGGEPTYQVLLDYDSATVGQSKSCGGFLDISTGKWTNGSTWYGTIISLKGYSGMDIKLQRATGASFIRYAYLTSSYYHGGSSAVFSQEPGYTGPIENTVDAVIEETIPSDALYLYLYIYSNGTVVAPSITVSGIPITSVYHNLPANLFTVGKTVNPSGGSIINTTTSVLSDSLLAATYSYNKVMDFKVNSYPSGVDAYRINVAEYTVNNLFIRRNEYTYAPFSIALTPATGFVRVIVECWNNGQVLTINSVLFDGNMLQVKGINDSL